MVKLAWSSTVVIYIRQAVADYSTSDLLLGFSRKYLAFSRKACGGYPI